MYPYLHMKKLKNSSFLKIENIAQNFILDFSIYNSNKILARYLKIKKYKIKANPLVHKQSINIVPYFYK